MAWDGWQNGWKGNKTKDGMEKEEEFKDRITPFGNWVFMEGSVEGWNTTSLIMISLFAFEFLLNSTTLDCHSNSCSCLSFSRSSYSFLSFSSLAFLIYSSFAFSSSSLFFFSFIFISSCSLFFSKTRSFSCYSFSLFFSSLSFSLLCCALSLCLLKSQSRLFLKSFSYLNLARFWMNASPMPINFSILDCCYWVILNEGGINYFHMHSFNSKKC